MSNPSQGVVIGRFMPPHNGHRYLIDFAAAYADRLTVFLCTLAGEPIPGELRSQWLRAMFPLVRIVHITEEIPEANRNNPESPRIWAQALTPHLPDGADYLFASEDYGSQLARELGAEYIGVDPGRNRISVSASQIRRQPMTYWDHLPPIVRPHYLRTVGVAAGQDSQELADSLARQFRTLSMAPPETAVPRLSAYLRAQHSALSQQANRLLFVPANLAESAGIRLEVLIHDGSDPSLPAAARKITLKNRKPEALSELEQTLLAETG